MIKSWGIPVTVESLRPGALPADYDHRGTAEERMRDLVSAGMEGAEARNDARQVAAVDAVGGLFRPRSVAPKIVTCPCGVEAIKGSPAAADHEREHGGTRKRG